MKKQEILKIIDSVMNNREIDSIRNAILAIRDKVIEYEDESDIYELGYAELPLRGHNELYHISPYFDGATKVIIDPCYKIDTGIYGAIWYE